MSDDFYSLFFSKESTISGNMYIARALSVEAAFILNALVDMCKEVPANGMNAEGFFLLNTLELHIRTGIPEGRQQTTALNLLSKNQIIATKLSKGAQLVKFTHDKEALEAVLLKGRDVKYDA